ncbi:dihydropyrimidinase [Ochrobactrum sp. CM-21-5]|nr:dihydropyrimidinase [Ochrobactrum sp. CM-21-5]MBC2887652.1 dihydropyrimidinase [Ochrobactrum sp. CM-21-5]
MDLVIKNGKIVTASDVFRADLGIKDGSIVQIGGIMPSAASTTDAAGLYVMPGGVDVHTHLDTPDFGTATADDYDTGTVAAACGGTTTIVDFCRQEFGQSLEEAIAGWHDKARGKAAIDYGFHIIIIDLNDEVQRELSTLPAKGISSFKLFMAYRGQSMVDDLSLIKAMDAARKADAMVMVHAENGDAAYYLQQKFIAEGKLTPEYHALSRPPRVEAEATARAIALAEITGAPLYVVHMTCKESLDELILGRNRGVDVLGETCTHYLYTTKEDLARDDFQGAKYVFTPPARTAHDQHLLWSALANGTLSAVSSDHSPWNFAGQKEMGRDDFTQIPNGAPGIEERMIMTYQGVNEGRISLSRFVDIVATTPARIFGLHPRKGSISIGSDADIVLWDPEATMTIHQASLHQNVDYTLYEGIKVQGLPRDVFLRGQKIVENRNFMHSLRQGQFLARKGPRASKMVKT